MTAHEPVEKLESKSLPRPGITGKGIRKQRYTKQGIQNQGIRSKVYLTTQPNCGRNTPLEFLTWNMKLWPFSHPLMSQSKNLNRNLFLGRFQCRLSGVTITRSGATPACAVTSPSRLLTQPDTSFRHQFDSQECMQPPDPASHHNVARNQISTSESLTTVSVIVPIRVTIAFQPNLAIGSHIARSHTL